MCWDNYAPIIKQLFIFILIVEERLVHHNWSHPTVLAYPTIKQSISEADLSTINANIWFKVGIKLSQLNL